ncbi:response regulator [Telluria aromaticivorans]|uniref:Response regulator n=1 Tax=Telluria aromaticivorans TaxID=2725995 RepID=A0A7Y2JYG7_9BURK|nr:response regulator [Telluria aromaticivorans]NNG23340.1 response regulator [Telluria aromaticivorans]
MPTKIGLQLMLVDPDDDLRLLLKTLLQMTGCRVRTAKNWGEAIALIDANPPDLIFTELFLGGATGLDFGSRIRSMPCAKDTFLVALTGLYYQGIARQAWAAGFDRFLLKPVQIDQILDVVRGVAKARGYCLNELDSNLIAAA